MKKKKKLYLFNLKTKLEEVLKLCLFIPSNPILSHLIVKLPEIPTPAQVKSRFTNYIHNFE